MKNGCSLCGGRLKNGVCTECGMDNRKSDAVYSRTLNRSECAKENLSHVHKQDKVEQYRAPDINKTRETKSPYTQKKPQNQRNMQKTSAKSRTGGFQSSGQYSPQKYTYNLGNANKGKNSGMLVTLFIGICMIVTVIAFLVNGYTEYSEAAPEYLSEDFGMFMNPEEEWEEISPAPVPEELNPVGEVWEQNLEAGAYVVGVDIPEGEYTLRGEEGSSFQVSDAEHVIFYMESFGTDEGDVSE